MSVWSMTTVHLTKPAYNKNVKILAWTKDVVKEQNAKLNIISHVAIAHLVFKEIPL